MCLRTFAAGGDCVRERQRRQSDAGVVNGACGGNGADVTVGGAGVDEKGMLRLPRVAEPSVAL